MEYRFRRDVYPSKTSRGVHYTAVIGRDGERACECKGFRYSLSVPKSCSHLDALVVSRINIIQRIAVSKESFINTVLQPILDNAVQKFKVEGILVYNVIRNGRLVIVRDTKDSVLYYRMLRGGTKPAKLTTIPQNEDRTYSWEEVCDFV